MPNTNPVTMSSYDEIISNLDLIIEKFKTDTVVVIRDANLTEAEQENVTKALGDKLGWYPNNSSKDLQRYQENHQRLERKEDAGTDEVVLPYHLEHVDYDVYVPIIAGVWNMFNFTADEEAGKTYFTDTSLIYRQMSKEWQEFLDKSLVRWGEDDGSVHITPAVQDHAHAATGGFLSDQREFIGMWVYTTNPSTPEYLEYVDTYASKRADG